MSVGIVNVSEIPEEAWVTWWLVLLFNAIINIAFGASQKHLCHLCRTV
jgi:hypothetical protein